MNNQDHEAHAEPAMSPSAGDFVPPPVAPPVGVPAAGQMLEPGSPAPATRKRSKILAIGAAAVVLLGGGIVAIKLTAHPRPELAAAPPSSGYSLVVPSAVDKWNLEVDRTTTQLADDLRAELAKQQPEFASAAVLGVYTQVSGNGGRLIFIGYSAGASPQLAQSLARSSPVVLDGAMLSAGVTNATDFPAGSLGGTLRCGTNSTGVPLCAWVDPDTLKIVVDGGAPNAAAAAVTTLDLRSAAEQ